MRTPDSVRAAQSARDKAWNWASVRGLPPGYIEGFKMDSYRGKPRFTDGICSVMGMPVEVQETHVVSSGRYERTKVAERRHYCYLDRQGTFFVDLVKPVYRGTQHAKYHPSAEYRYLGFFFLDCDKDLIFWRGQDVTDVSDIIIARDDFEGYSDYACSGDEDNYIDHEYFQDAVDYASAIGGGRILVRAGDYYFGAAASYKSNVTIAGDNAGGVVIQKNCDDYAFKAVGVSGTEIENIRLENLTVTRDAADTNAKALVRWNYVDESAIISVTFLDGYYDGIRAINCDNLTIADNVFLKCGRVSVEADGCVSAIIRGNKIDGQNTLTSSASAMRGIHVTNDSSSAIVSGNIVINLRDNAANSLIGILVAGPGTIVSNNVLKGIVSTSQLCVGISVTASGDNASINGNRLDDCYTLASTRWGKISIATGAEDAQVKSNTCIDNGNLIDRGSCERLTSPMIAGERVPIVQEGTWARSDVRAYEGTYSWLLTKSGALKVYLYLTDSADTADMHGLVAGLTYTKSIRLYLPTGTTAAHVVVEMADYASAAWQYTSASPAATYNAWQLVTVERTLRAAATGFLLRITIDAAADAADKGYFDNLRLQPIGVHNEHSQQFIDDGTGTSLGNNSWQNPFGG